MTQPTFALAIPWCPWIPERVECMTRLRGWLGITPMGMPACIVDDGYREFTDRLPNDRWSEDVWTYLAGTTAEWCVQLQEDALVPERFWAILSAMLEALPESAEIVGLQAPNPIGRALAREGHRWYTSADALVGVGYAIRRTTLVAFLEWRRDQLRDGWRSPTEPKKLPAITEDTMIGLFALSTGRRVWHPIPTIVDHDTSLRSVWGNDDHVNRRSVVTWEGDAWTQALAGKTREALEDPAFWGRVEELAEDAIPWEENAKRVVRFDLEVPHVGRFYDVTPSMAYTWVKDFDQKAFTRARQDNGAEVKRRLSHAALARMPSGSRDRVLVLTPTRGDQASMHYNSTVWRASRWEGIELLAPWEILDAWQWHEDIVRVRSRMLRAGLETDATAFWWLDADVEASLAALRGMLGTHRPFVLTPYPRRDQLHWDRVAQIDPRHPEARAYSYAVRLDQVRNPGGTIDEDLTTVIGGMGLGCAILRRDAAEKILGHAEKAYKVPDFAAMAARFFLNPGPTAEDAATPLPSPVLLEELLRQVWLSGVERPPLGFDDLFEGKKYPTIAAFAMRLRNRELLSEDHSFCMLAAEAGIEPRMYVGPGSPATHHGTHAYRGHLEAFGLKLAEVKP